MFSFIEGVFRWHNRVVAYALTLVTDQYRRSGWRHCPAPQAATLGCRRSGTIGRPCGPDDDLPAELSASVRRCTPAAITVATKLGTQLYTRIHWLGLSNRETRGIDAAGADYGGSRNRLGAAADGPGPS
jgi:hypothetical protein